MSIIGNNAFRGWVHLNPPQTEDKVGAGFIKIQHPSFVSYVF